MIQTKLDKKLELCKQDFKKCTHLQLRSIINLRDVAKVEELSEPEFTQHADTAAISIYPQCFPVFLEAEWYSKTPSDLDHSPFISNLNIDIDIWSTKQIQIQIMLMELCYTPSIFYQTIHKALIYSENGKKKWSVQ